MKMRALRPLTCPLTFYYRLADYAIMILLVFGMLHFALQPYKSKEVRSRVCGGRWGRMHNEFASD